MKPMNFDFLNKVAKQEKTPPRVCSGVTTSGKMSPLGALIWNARIHKNLSQEAFAQKCDIDLEDVIRVEDDETYSPDIRTIHAISQFLKVDNSLLAEIAGFIKVRDPFYEQQLYSFAASSRKIRDSSETKLEIFEQYLAVLHERGIHHG